MYDLIGDIHGHADELVRLLELLGYEKAQEVYRHRSRKVVFVGDFIDRGPKIRQVLEIVRPMVEQGAALAVMGNHELNALAFHTEEPAGSGRYLRKRNNKNIRQHAKTILQLTEDELSDALAWFRALPMWLDLEGIRVVHACWDPAAIDQIAAGLQAHGGVTTEFLREACTAGQGLFDPVELVLKGKEVDLPPGTSFRDKDGHLRDRTRVKWYLSPEGQTYRSYALTDEIDCDLAIEPSIVREAVPYRPLDKPVFIGHYWLPPGRPRVVAENVACLDFSVAKEGLLCAYRWNGEQKLSDENFVWVGATKEF